MKGITIALAALLLMMGMGTARAASEPHAGDSVAVAVGQVAPQPDAEMSSIPSDFAIDPDFRLTGDAELPVGRAMTLWGYDISPQVSIDLGIRPPEVENVDFDPVRDSVAVKQLAQNLMVGFHYQF
jgi:hypothetical protein